MHTEVRKLIKQAEYLGFTFIGFDGNEHPRFRHDQTGSSYSLPLTPSEYRSIKNTRATLERISGRKLPRPNSGHFRYQHQTMSNTHRSLIERQCSQEIEALITEAESLRKEFTRLAAEPSYTTADRARDILKRYEQIRYNLARSHRVIGPIDLVEVAR